MVTGAREISVQVLDRNAGAAGRRTRFQSILEAVATGLACRLWLGLGQEKLRKSDVVIYSFGPLTRSQLIGALGLEYLGYIASV